MAGNDVDISIGGRIRYHRKNRNLSVQAVADVLKMTVLEYKDAECGKVRFSASDMFSLKKKYNFPIKQFFSHDGQYFPDVIYENTDMADIFHYFLNIECENTRLSLLRQIKLASSVF